MKNKFFQNNKNRLHSIESDDFYIPDRKRVQKFRKDNPDREDVRYNNSNKKYYKGTNEDMDCALSAIKNFCAEHTCEFIGHTY